MPDVDEIPGGVVLQCHPARLNTRQVVIGSMDNGDLADVAQTSKVRPQRQSPNRDAVF